MPVGIDERRGLLRHGDAAAAAFLQAFERADERRHQIRVELGAAAAPHLLEALPTSQAHPVWPAARHRVVSVDEAHGPRDDGDGRAGQTIGVAVAVEALMMMAHRRGQLPVEEGPHDLGADARVLAHELPPVSYTHLTLP